MRKIIFIVLLIALFVCGYAYAGSYSGYDSKGNYSNLKKSPFGGYNGYDSKGNYFHFK